MLRLFFLRHGNTFEEGEPSRQVGAKTDISLTEKGRQQAAAAARWFSSEGIVPAAIYAGVLKRQQETAAIASGALGTPVQNALELAELSYGAWENKTIEELKTQFPVSYEAWSKEGTWPEEFEGTYEDTRRRLTRFLDKVRCSHEDGSSVIAVTSQGVMKLVTAVIEPQRWSDLQARKEIDALKVKTGALCEIVFDDGGWKTVAWNVVPE